jgi:hypothetical protein
MIFFCRPGTTSGGISTPRSPRATMMPSTSSRISSSRSIACGFSILAMIAARPTTSLRASATSSGRWTKLSATQSKPMSMPNARSFRSLGVSAEIGRIAFGTLTPLRFDKGPPVTATVSAKSPPTFSTFSRILPSSSRRSVPAVSALKISG